MKGAKSQESVRERFEDAALLSLKMGERPHLRNVNSLEKLKEAKK